MRGNGARSLLADDRGMALLITIMIISLLVVVTLEFGRTMRQNHLAAANLKNSEQLGAIARSGITLAVALLEKDGKDTAADSLLEDWATVDKADLSELFDQGLLQLRITDLSGNLQINSLIKSGEAGNAAREIMLRLLLSGEFVIEGDKEANEIIDSLVDWLDPDDLESDGGAENSYYQSRSPAYSCRNGPVGFVEELLLIKGITPALLFGVEGKKGLAQFITVHGDDGKININTAQLLLLQALDPQISTDLAIGLDEFRRDKDNKELLANATWYQNVPSWPGDIVFDEDLITTTGTFFSLEATGILETRKRKIVAVVQRAEQGRITELNRKAE